MNVNSPQSFWHFAEPPDNTYFCFVHWRVQYELSVKITGALLESEEARQSYWISTGFQSGWTEIWQSPRPYSHKRRGYSTLDAPPISLTWRKVSSTFLKTAASARKHLAELTFASNDVRWNRLYDELNLNQLSPRSYPVLSIVSVKLLWQWVWGNKWHTPLTSDAQPGTRRKMTSRRAEIAPDRCDVPKYGCPKLP